MYAYTHVFTLPPTEAKELPALLQKHASDLFPIPSNEFVLDWSVLPQQDGDTHLRVFVSAVPKSHIESMFGALRESQFVPVTAENECISLARALLPDHLSVTVLIDIDSTTTNVSIIDDATLLPKVTLSIPIGDDAFTTALSARQNIDAKEAMRMKNEEGFDITKGEGWTIVVLQERVQLIIHEVEKAFAHYERTFKRPIERIVLCGVGSAIPKLDTYIGVNLKRPLITPDPLQVGSVVPTFPFRENPISYASLIGLFLRETKGTSVGKYAVNFARHWAPTRTPLAIVRDERFWRQCAIATFSTSFFLSGVLLYQTLLLPVARYDKERAMRTPPLTPFHFVGATSTSTSEMQSTTTPSVPTGRIRK
jgi:Tfp pilus assembly PilM family ATPase